MTKRAAEQLVTCQDLTLTYNFTLHHLLHPFELRVPNDRLLTCLRRLKTYECHPSAFLIDHYHFL